MAGQINPGHPGADTARLQEGAAGGAIRFVPIEAQVLSIEPGDWLDMAHVNERGRARYRDIFVEEWGKKNCP
jgi:hypothetical protein